MIGPQQSTPTLNNECQVTHHLPLLLVPMTNYGQVIW
jgi:hypothetical protein